MKYCGGPAASLQYTVSLVHWVNRLIPAWGGGGAVRVPWMHPHLQWNRVLLLAMSLYCIYVSYENLLLSVVSYVICFSKFSLDSK